MMKKLWKALGITVLAAAFIPYRFRKDKDEGSTHVDALLWQVTRRPGNGDDEDIVDISLGFKSPLHEVREERKLFTDDPEEAMLFADNEPEAAVPAPAHAGEAPAEQAAEPVVTEEDFDPDL